MFDFLTVKKNFVAKQQRYEYYPSFLAKSKIKDLMIRSRDFYALINPETGFWITDEGEAIELIDKQVYEYVVKDVGEQLMSDPEHSPIIKRISDTDTHLIDKWHKFCQKDLRDFYEPLNQKIIFSNSEVSSKDYVTYKLDYPLQEQPTPYYDKLVDRLYLPDEAEKFEWAVGCVLAGDISKIQKLFVFFGEPGTGKSTIINKVIVDTIFGGYRSPYCTKFTASLLTTRDSFGTDFLSRDPVIAFDDDADLSRIDDKTTLNLIVSHEVVRVNSKFKSPFLTRPNCILICGTNEPIQLSPNSGLNRRLIDIRQTGLKLSPDEYDECIHQLQFEKSGIAYKCLETYKRLGKSYYNHYTPESMLSMSSPFHNYVKDNYFELKDGITLANAYNIYTKYCEECNYKTVMTRYKFRDNLKLYFETYEENFFSDFKVERIGMKKVEPVPKPEVQESWLKFDKKKSIFDQLYSEQPAQYANDEGNPRIKWSNVKSLLKELDTTKLHYVKIPKDVIVIDFDIKDESGNKSFEKNLEAASKFPKTYAELSKSGTGIHLHYIYTGGDPEQLSRSYSDNVEVKVFVGNAALRRKLTKCNDLPIAELSSGLPLKGGKTKMIDWDGYKNEKILRSMIIKNLNKEYHPNTKPSIDYIWDLLDKAYRSGASYDVRDLEQAVFGFALQSTNKKDYCLDAVSKMHFCSDDFKEENVVSKEYNEAPIVFYDIESYPEDEDGPALFVLCWKFQGKDKEVVKLFNPKPKEVEELFKFRLIGFNNRKYDNHMIYAASQGYTPAELNKLSRKLIDQNSGQFREAYNISYTDILDFAAKKQSLKKWEIELGIHHMEMGIPWDKSAPKKRWKDIGEYCANDVIATEALFDHLQPDFIAREILAELSGLTVNDTNRQHIIRLLVGNEKKPKLVYTDLATGKQEGGSGKSNYINAFPGYEFALGEDGKYHNMYRGVDVGFGGYVHAEPGMYRNVAMLDVGNMHGASTIALNKFGEHTKVYEEIRDARMAIKHKDFDKARKMFGGRLAKYLDDESRADDLQNALKLVLNSTYGIAAATFDNPIRDPRDVNNTIALRGALFMKTLQDEVVAKGFKVIHIKTDSIKIPNATKSIIKFCMDFAKKYGYEFEHECTYDRICLINDAVYIAKYDDQGIRNKGGKKAGEWTATGKQFAVPYVFKTLFSHKEIIFDDLCETFSVDRGAAIYLDMNESLPDVTELEKELKKQKKELVPEAVQKEVEKKIAKGHDYQFVGRVGQFTPIISGQGGGVLTRIAGTKHSALSGTKGYRWLESEMVQTLKKEDCIDRSYYRKLVDDAVDAIGQYGNVDDFIGWDFSRYMNPPEEPTVEDYVNNVPETDKEELPFD